jgi:Uma2 family endonuclease
MKAGETAFRSDEVFGQKQFRCWVEQRPRADINRYELIDGRIVMTRPAGQQHARVEIKLAQLINEHVENEKLGIALGSSAGYDLPSGETLEPDVSYISSARLVAGPRTGPDQFLRVVPNLVVEILSPSTAKRDQTEKKEIYAHNGVDEYWIVDPRRRTVTVYSLTKRAYGAGRAYTSGSVRSRVLPKLHIEIEKLFTL